MKKNILSANKAQSMTEMAVFGSLLLMVLAWLIQMGMTYTEQQKLNMEAFRTALGVAAEDNATNHTQLVYVKDVHIPNPQDKLGMGSRQTLGAGDYVTWTNNSENLANLEPVLVYWFNPGGSTETNRAYTLSDRESIANSGINVTVPATSTTNAEIAFIPVDRTSIYNKTNELTGSEQYKTRVLLPVNGLGEATMSSYDPYCQTNYCPTDIVDKADVNRDGRVTEEYIYDLVGTPGQPPQRFKVINYSGGDIDGDKTVVNFEGPAGEQVAPDQKQGLLSPEVTYSRDDENRIQDDKSNTNSVDILKQSDLINHRVRKNDAAGSIDIIPQDFIKQGTETWTTPK
jgi:hypothetical protein